MKIIALVWGAVSAQASDLHVAVASNFGTTAKEISQKFTEQSHISVILTLAASGKIFSQIQNGAPFDVFLSADISRPQELIKNHLAEPGSYTVYALGQLAVWAPGLNRFAGAASFKDSAIKHIAIANPRLAPYGTGAEEVIKHLGLDKIFAQKIIQGENVAHVYQYTQSGNCELGFVAYSQIINKAKPETYWVIPQNYYSPIKQGAVILASSKNKSTAQKFLAFLKGPAAQSIIRKNGYGLDLGAP